MNGTNTGRFIIATFQRTKTSANAASPMPRFIDVMGALVRSVDYEGVTMRIGSTGLQASDPPLPLGDPLLLLVGSKGQRV
jgi:hypothetical protein